MTKKVLITIDEKDEEMIEFLKPIVKSKARTKVFKFCLKKTYEMLKE